MLFCHLQIAEFQLRNLIGALSHFPYIWGIFLLLLLKFFPWFLLMLSSPCHACSVVSDSLWLHELQLTRLLCPWDFPDKNTRVDYHFLLQGIFPTRGLNLSLLHWQVDSFTTESSGNPVLSWNRLFWELWISWTWMPKSLHSFGKFSRINILNALPLFSFWNFSNCRCFFNCLPWLMYTFSPSVHSFISFVFSWKQVKLPVTCFWLLKVFIFYLVKSAVAP